MPSGRPLRRSLPVRRRRLRSSRGGIFPCDAHGVRDLLVDHRLRDRPLHSRRVDAPVIRRWVKEQSLTLFFLVLFALSLVGQSFAGLHDFNAEQAVHGGDEYSYWRYLVSSQFGGDVMENWQSEFLQFSLLILATVWLVQRGSTESKKVEDAGPESDERARRQACARESATLGEGEGLAPAAVRELARVGDADDLP